MPARFPNPQGAYLTGSQSGGGSTSTKVLLDTVDPAYPYTALSANTLTLKAAGWVTVAASSGMTLGYSMTITLEVNGTTVATGTASASPSVLTYGYQAHAGDALTLWETDNSFGAGSMTTGTTSTFLHVTPSGPPTWPGPIPVARAAFF
jgi:hypothetical protein